ncbi:GNAT family N-acetyltransferase [Micromonospora sp. NPDC050200]|uniref:GNAT family N-acetyltransferase n=1 Tax=Micromonospora sp. NPDC050200 TaxID=3155664 RepID=UPI0033EE8B49
MTPVVRPLRPADVPAVAEVLAAAAPYQMITEEWLGWHLTGAPAAERFGVLVAGNADGVVGAALTGLLHESAEPGLGFVNLTVHPERRGGGAGSALLDAAQRRLTGLGAVAAYAKVADDPASTGFAQRRGYRRGRRAEFLVLDLAEAVLPASPALPAGVRLLAAAELPDPHPLYTADLDASRDEPGEVTMDEISYADWLAAYWERPDLDRELTTVAVRDGQVLAFGFAMTDRRDRYRSGMTGTRRGHRGRGLARAVKQRSLSRARAAGLRYAYTSNDAGNVAMLTLNRGLGYRAVAAEWRYLRDLSD